MKSHSFAHRLNWLAVFALVFNFMAPILPALAQDECAPMISIESPQDGDVSGAFTGWAIDQNVVDGSGILAVQVVVDGQFDQGGTFVGIPDFVPRPDIDEAWGRMDTYGFTLTSDISGLSSGPHTFYVYVWTTCGPAYATVAVTIPVLLAVEKPKFGDAIMNGQEVVVGGWTSGSRVDVYLDGPAGQGRLLGTLIPKGERTDVVAVTGRQDLLNSGFDTIWSVSNLSAGAHTLTFVSEGNGASASETVSIIGIGSPATSASTQTQTAPQTQAPPANNVVKIEVPTANSTLTGQRQFSGIGVDCSTGTPARQIRVYRGTSTTGTTAGNAIIGTVSKDLSQACSGSGLTGSAAIGWTASVDTIGSQDGMQTFTVVGEFANGATAQASISATVSNYGTTGLYGNTNTLGAATNCQGGYVSTASYGCQPIGFGGCTGGQVSTQTYGCQPGVATSYSTNSSCPAGQTFTATGCQFSTVYQGGYAGNCQAGYTYIGVAGCQLTTSQTCQAGMVSTTLYGCVAIGTQQCQTGYVSTQLYGCATAGTAYGGSGYGTTCQAGTVSTALYGCVAQGYSACAAGQVSTQLYGCATAGTAYGGGYYGGTTCTAGLVSTALYGCVAQGYSACAAGQVSTQLYGCATAGTSTGYGGGTYCPPPRILYLGICY
ncbi:MAG: repeat-associated core domain protein [Chloroflexi bacterium]|nr:repeat-associated core domain protein [Chloroflexota bacterium]